MAASSTPEAAGTGWRRWLVSWPLLIALFLVPGAAWAVGNPLFAVADEPAHTVKAVAVWEGQLDGRDERGDNGYISTYVVIPAIWQKSNDLPACFAFQRNNTPDCAPAFDGGTEPAEVATTAGHYPPFYYALVGWPSRLWPQARGMYGMRLVSALAGALLLAWATRVLARTMRPGLALAGVLAAATPTTWFLIGAVNPNGFEIAAAIALWAHALALARLPASGRTVAPDGTLGSGATPTVRVPTWLLVGLPLATVPLAFTRSLSPLFALAILALSVLAVPRGGLLPLLRDRRALVAAGTSAAIAVVAFLFVLRGGHLESVPGVPLPPDTDPVREVAGLSNLYVEQMIGVFGWMDTRIAQVSFYVWVAVYALAGFGSLVLGRLRDNLALLATFVVVALLPILAQAPRAEEQGLAWQGRYALPLVVGLPLLGLLGLDQLGDRIAGARRRLAVVVTSLLAIGNLYAYWWNLRRYVSGGDLDLSIFEGFWQPPVGGTFWFVVMVLWGGATVAITALDPPSIAHPDRPSPGRPGAEGGARPGETATAPADGRAEPTPAEVR